VKHIVREQWQAILGNYLRGTRMCICERIACMFDCHYHPCWQYHL